MSGNRSRSSRRSSTTPRRATTLSRSLAILALLLGVLAQESGKAADDLTDALPYSLSYTVTGDYAVGSVDLLPSPNTGGFQTGTIHMGTATERVVPKNAEILAAFLYWETLAETEADLEGVLFRGTPVSFVRTLSQELTGVFAPCWSNSGNTLYAMRADVLSLLPPQLDENGNPTGRRLVNDVDLIAATYLAEDESDRLHTVTLPERGVGNQTPQSAGASLFVVYRDVEGAAALKRIVVYDGVHVQAKGTSTQQKIRGFLQSAGGAAKVTQITSRGAANATDQVTFVGAGANTVQGNLFAGSLSPDSDRSWIDSTIDVTPSMPGANGGEYGEQLTMTSLYTDPASYGCQTWSAIAFSTAIPDVDNDGLIDLLETDSGVSYKDPAGNAYPNLYALGARTTQKDLFVEVNSMVAAPNTSYGSATHPFPLPGQDLDGNGVVTDAAGHDHRPLPTTLTLVGDALLRAGVHVHFDVGPLAQNGSGYFVGGVFRPFPAALPGDDRVPVYPAPSTYFINQGATGGETIPETPCVVNDAAESLCQFPAFPGTVGWKFHFQTLRDELLNAETGLRRFDPMRNGFFHYLLYAHARGSASSPFPCLNGSEPEGFDPDSATCEAPAVQNPDFHVPLGASGVADLPGFNAMITLGLSKNFLGTEYFQASTTLHELGHTMELWHGGARPTFTDSLTMAGRVKVTVEPNCKPNYQSSMSYLHQLYGLIGADGLPHIDYSDVTLGIANGTIDESNISDSPLQGGMRYRAAWYAPIAEGTLGAALGVPAASSHCDGSPILDTDPEVGTGRLQADEVSPEMIDWAGDGAASRRRTSTSTASRVACSAPRRH